MLTNRNETPYLIKFMTLGALNRNETPYRIKVLDGECSPIGMKSLTR